MKYELHNYDVYPKAFLTGVEKTITIKPMGLHAEFNPDEEYVIYVKEVNIAEDRRFAGGGSVKTLASWREDDGCLRVHNVFEREGMYLTEIRRRSDDAKLTVQRVYALEHDMAGRYPYRGDLHMHSCRSDGREGPAVVAANYRGHGYDFTVISDHGRYYPSLEAREALRISGEEGKSDLTDMLIVQGEEVHLPLNAVHYVNFGGKFSINALVRTTANKEKAGDDPKWRSLDGDCPDTMSGEEFEETIRERAKSVPRELESERLSFAVAQWIYEMQKKAGGLGIFPHPYWLCTTMQLSEDYVYFFYKERPFDAFEVLGGERYFEHNGFQTIFYYEMKAKGYDYPIVGSTDSHGSTENNAGGQICSTIVFAPSNTTPALVDSIKAKYSVAVDTISSEYRLVGDLRLVKYGSFLMEEWYPLHDLACKCEGYYLKQFACGDENYEKILLDMKGQIPRMISKYFELEEDPLA